MPAVWQRGEIMGLVHTECATDPDAQPTDLSKAQGQHFNEKI